MTDRTLDPRDDRRDEFDAPRRDDGYDDRRDLDAPRRDHDVDEPVVDLDHLGQGDVDEEDNADDKYITVVDGRPETLGYETQEGPGDTAQDTPVRTTRDDSARTTEPGSYDTQRQSGGSHRADTDDVLGEDAGRSGDTRDPGTTGRRFEESGS